MSEDKIIIHMMDLKDDRDEIEEKDLIEEVDLLVEDHETVEKDYGMVVASNGEMYFENNMFLNKPLLVRLNKI